MRLIAVLCWFFAFAAQPAVAASSPELVPLEQQLASVLAMRSGDYGVAALDLGSGKMVSVNGNQAYPMASTVKVAVAAAYLAQVDNGHRSLDDRIGARSVRTLMEAMLIHSDNYATDLIIRDLGGPATVQTWLNWNNMQGIRMDRTIAQLLRDKRDLWDPRDSSTPEAMVRMLRTIDRGNVLKPESRSYLLGTMARCMTGKNRIRAFLPTGTPVQNKTGTLNGLSSDVGFITLPDGRRIAVAFFARGGTDRSRSIAVAARAVYDGFAYGWRRFTGSFTPAAPAGGLR
jgi:beta-lactamase class A